MMFWTGVMAVEKERIVWIGRILARQNCQNLVISWIWRMRKVRRQGYLSLKI